MHQLTALQNYILFCPSNRHSFTAAATAYELTAPRRLLGSQRTGSAQHSHSADSHCAYTNGHPVTSDTSLTLPRCFAPCTPFPLHLQPTARSLKQRCDAFPPSWPRPRQPHNGKTPPPNLASLPPAQGRTGRAL